MEKNQTASNISFLSMILGASLLGITIALVSISLRLDDIVELLEKVVAK